MRQWGASWNYRCSDNGGSDPGWGCTAFAYQPDGYWTIQNGVYPEAGYLGPWEGTITDNAETALNKTEAAVGHFDIFTILRGDYVKRFDQSYMDATYDNPLDITYVLENPGGERRTPIGWKTTGASWQGQGNSPAGKVGGYYIEAYNGAGVGSSDIYQEISGLPDGYYRFSVRGLVRDGGDQGFMIYANSESTKVTAPDLNTTFNVVVQVTDGNLRVGCRADNVTKDWIAFDNAKLEYLGLDIPGYNVGTPTLNIAENSYIQSLDNVTFNFTEANSNVQGAVFTVLNNSKASLYKGNTKVGDYMLYASEKTVSVNLSSVTLDADATYRIELPAGAVGYAGQATNEAVSVTFKTPVVFDDTYYLYNTYTQNYLSRGGTWATACILDDWGLAMIVNTNAAGQTTLKYFDSQAYLYNEGWCYGDGATGLNFTVSKVNGGYKFLRENTNDYMAVYDGRAVSDAREGDNLVGTSNVWALESTSEHTANYTRNADAQASAAATAASINNITTKNDLDTYLTTTTGTVDVTITGAKAQQYQNYAAQAEALTEAEYYKETVGNLPSGLYRLSVDAFQRACGFDDVRDADGARGSIYVYANDAKTQIKSVMEYGAPDAYDSDYAANNLHYPNNENSGYAALETGNYSNVVYVYVNGGTLTFGINNPNRLGNGIARGTWCVYQNFRLERVASSMTIADTDDTAPRATHVDVTLTRTLKGGQWNGFSVPFNIADISTLGTVKEFDSANDNVITFKNATAIVAGVPYIVKPTADVVNPVFNDVDVTNPQEVVQGDGDYKFVAHLYNTSLPIDGSVAYISTTDSSVKKLTSGGIKGMRSYFQIPTATTARPLVLKFDAEETAIMDLQMNIIQDSSIYNVAGQRIHQPRKGINIVNGRKVVIK